MKQKMITVDTWGNSRAAMIEGPDRVAIELVEVK